MKKVCAVQDCDGSAARRGWCVKHYTRFLRHGHPEGGGYGRGHVQEWLQKHASWDGEECLIWPFYCDPNGYGRVSHDGRDQIAARVMCALAHGQPPTERHEAAHSCGQGHAGCVNPKHLRWATPHENQMDKAFHGTDTRGEKAWNAKLTEADVKNIRERLSHGESQRSIASDFGVHQVSVSLINRRINWGWL